MLNPIIALSPLDGRYGKQVEALRPIFSEYGLMKCRVQVELEWLKALSRNPKIKEVPEFSAPHLTSACKNLLWGPNLPMPASASRLAVAPLAIVHNMCRKHSPSAAAIKAV